MKYVTKESEFFLKKLLKEKKNHFYPTQFCKGQKRDHGSIYLLYAFMYGDELRM